MTTQETITLYKYSELPTEEAKEKARQWAAEGEGEDFSDFGATDTAPGGQSAPGSSL